MSDSHFERHPEREDKRSFLRKVVEFIHPGPDSREELLADLSQAEHHGLISSDSRFMLEGVIRLADMTAGDIMVAAPRMDLIDIDAPFDVTLRQVINAGHSRFPVYCGDQENIIGILLAKDLLKLQCSPTLKLRTLLRPVTFIPETKGLNDLLRAFRGNRNHLAIVVDEFGRIAGLITIEDVLEQIVGEIEDEFDLAEDDNGDIFALSDQTYRISGDTPIERVEEALKIELTIENAEETFDTIGGLIAHEMSHVPRRGESHELAGWRFSVLLAKGGAVKWFKVEPLHALKT